MEGGRADARKEGGFEAVLMGPNYVQEEVHTLEGKGSRIGCG
jgi:hypothetical protein